MFRKDPNDPEKHAFVVDFIYPDKRKVDSQYLFSHAIDDTMQVIEPKDGQGNKKLPSDAQHTINQLFHIHITGINVTVDLEEQKRISKEIYEHEKHDVPPPDVPADWLSTTTLQRKYSLTNDTIRYALREIILRDDKEEVMIGSDGKRYFAPSICKSDTFLEIITFYRDKREADILTHELYANGWQSVDKELRKELQMSDTHLRNIVTTIAKEYPDLVKYVLYRFPDKKKILVSPEAIDMIMIKYGNKKIPPEYISQQDIEMKAGIANGSSRLREKLFHIAKRLAHEQRTPINQLISTKRGRGHQNYFYHPSIAEEYLKERETLSAPDGFTSVNAMESNFAVTRTTVQKAVRFFESKWKDIDDLRTYIEVKGNVGTIPVYSQEFWGRIKKVLPPPGWKVSRLILEQNAEVVGGDEKKFREQLRKLFRNEPNWVRDLGEIPGLRGLYCHPNIVQEYKRRLRA